MDIARTILNNYKVTWNGYDTGSHDKVTLSVPVKKKPIKVGSVGDVKLGDRLLGLDDGAKISVAVREIDLTFFQEMFPWWSSGPISGTPATPQVDLYTYAQLLTLHPNHLPDATVTQDYNFLKAVPEIGDNSRDGVADGTTMVDFWLYPDRDELPTRVYYYIGAVPA